MVASLTIGLFHVKNGGCLTHPNPEVDDKDKHYKLQSLGIMSSQKLQLPVLGLHTSGLTNGINS